MKKKKEYKIVRTYIDKNGNVCCEKKVEVEE